LVGNHHPLAWRKFRIHRARCIREDEFLDSRLGNDAHNGSDVAR
jgi:hypothetical protein